MLTIQLSRDGTAIVGALVAAPWDAQASQAAQAHRQQLPAAWRLLSYLRALHDDRAAVIRLTQLTIYQRMLE